MASCGSRCRKVPRVCEAPPAPTPLIVRVPTASSPSSGSLSGRMIEGGFCILHSRVNERGQNRNALLLLNFAQTKRCDVRIQVSAIETTTLDTVVVDLHHLP